MGDSGVRQRRGLIADRRTDGLILLLAAGASTARASAGGRERA